VTIVFHTLERGIEAKLQHIFDIIKESVIFFFN